VAAIFSGARRWPVHAMADASNRGILLGMQCPIDPRAQSRLLGELVSRGIGALGAEGIVERKGEPMPATAEPHTHSAPGSNGAAPSPESVMQLVQGLQVAGILKGAVDFGVFDEIPAAGRGA